MKECDKQSEVGVARGEDGEVAGGLFLAVRRRVAGPEPCRSLEHNITSDFPKATASHCMNY